MQIRNSTTFVAVILLFGFFNGAAMAALSTTAAPTPLRPMVTKRCLTETPRGTCKEFEYTYSILGAHCTEECLVQDSFGKCKLKNTCQFDQNSHCFKKSTCIDIDAYDKCKEWIEEPQCL